MSAWNWNQKSVKHKLQLQKKNVANTNDMSSTIILYAHTDGSVMKNS